MNESQSERWARIESIFVAALQRDPEQRAAWVRASSGGDGAMEREVLALLEGHDSAGGDAHPDRLLTPGGRTTSGEATGARVGPWAIGELIGRGGMGDVYRAQRADAQYEQQVAIKVMRP
ncbi:MAG: hypothetical protein JNL26_01790, partial [Gemmatimonadetes bacterium]|nr:hypothetical protein [Gemmatimonadota bacterium]